MVGVGHTHTHTSFSSSYYYYFVLLEMQMIQLLLKLVKYFKYYFMCAGVEYIKHNVFFYYYLLMVNSQKSIFQEKVRFKANRNRLFLRNYRSDIFKKLLFTVTFPVFVYSSTFSCSDEQMLGWINTLHHHVYYTAWYALISPVSCHFTPLPLLSSWLFLVECRLIRKCTLCWICPMRIPGQYKGRWWKR